jgi:heptosyltransferase-2
MSMTDCRYFSGYKPCGKSEICDSLCPKFSKCTSRVLLIHLEALGAVVRSTSLLSAIRRKFPGCHLTWVTQKPADQLLKENPLIDRVLTTDPDDLLQLSALEFDVAFVVDKSLKSVGVLKQTTVDLVYGFTADARTGTIVPATEAATELWEIGLSNEKKFYINQKSETQLIHEALELGPWIRDEYKLSLNQSERFEMQRRRSEWAAPRQTVVGLNTGCSSVIPNKKLSIEMHRDLIRRLLADHYRVVLLGGREDTARNERIAYGLNVVQSPTERGLRDGIVSVAACDIVVTGDSLGMHLAIALEKWTVAWFGPTCAQEIDLYDRGVRVLTQASCSPCWKRSCDKSPMCYDLVRVEDLVGGVQLGAAKLTSDEQFNPRSHLCPVNDKPNL